MLKIFRKQIKLLGNKTMTIDEMGSNYIKTMMNYLQFISIFNSFGFKSSESDAAISRASETLSGSFFSIFSLDCLLQNIEHAPVIYLIAFINSFIPPTIIGIFAIKILISKSSFKLSEILISSCFTLFILQPNIIQSDLDIFNCLKLNVDKAFILKELSVECYTNDYFKWMLMMAGPSFIIYALLMPGGFFLYLFKKRKELNDQDFYEKVGFLIHGFSKKTFYWEYIILWKKILIIFCSIFIDNLPTKVCLTIIFLIFLNIFQLNDQPYLTKKLNRLELISNITLILMLLVKTISFYNENLFTNYICQIIIVIFQISIPIICLLNFLMTKIINIKLFKKMIDFLNEKSKVYKIMTIEFKEYKSNLGKSEIIEDDAILYPMSAKRNNSTCDINFLKLIMNENEKLKAKIQKMKIENEMLKKQNNELFNLNNELSVLTPLKSDKILSKELKVNPKSGDNSSEFEETSNCEEFYWKYYKRKNLISTEDFVINCEKESSTNQNKLLKNKELKFIKNMKFQLKNITNSTWQNAEIKCEFSESNTKFS